MVTVVETHRKVFDFYEAVELFTVLNEALTDIGSLLPSRLFAYLYVPVLWGTSCNSRFINSP